MEMLYLYLVLVTDGIWKTKSDPKIFLNEYKYDRSDNYYRFFTWYYAYWRNAIKKETGYQ
jgi:hypothetical protein